MKMEIMEEGNLLDRVRILLQRDLDYYSQHQTVLQETLCPGIVGGLLDFPHYASFAAVKLVMWWEEQFKGAFRKPSGLLGTACDDGTDGMIICCSRLVYYDTYEPVTLKETIYIFVELEKESEREDAAHKAGFLRQWAWNQTSSIPSWLNGYGPLSCREYPQSHADFQRARARLYPYPSSLKSHCGLYLSKLPPPKFMKPIADCPLGAPFPETEQTTSADVDRGCGGIVANAAPAEFVKMAMDTSHQLLEHLHVLSQEALDHADLTVLTGTLGAAALIKNTLWCYNEQIDVKGSSSLHSGYKEYQEMSEALAERLLDLHCRLLSLYVMQDADSLSWDHPHPFFEGERGSFVVQMWWLYMQGTRQDLWDSVPPKTAQRVLAGMLNESLTILASRYNQAEPSPARSLLLITDIGNILMCVNELLPSICGDASELLGLDGGSKILRDIHSKCHQLLICFVLRGCSLSTLFKVFRNGLEGVVAFEERCESFAPWMLLVAPELQRSAADSIAELPDGDAIMLEMKVLAAQPQPSYPLLLNILTMRDFKVATLLLNKMIPLLATEDPKPSDDNALSKCKGFLCSGGGDCKSMEGSAHDAVHALTAVLINVCTVEDISRLVLPAIEMSGPSWANCLDRHQVWNLNRPPWLSAILAYLESPLLPLVHTIIRAANSGETVEETISLTLAGLIKLADIIPPQIFKVAFVLQEEIPADVKPLGKSVLMQMLLSVIYELLTKSKEDSAIALAEALCHLRVPSYVIEQLEDAAEEYADDTELALVSDITVSRILFTHVGRRALKSTYQCVMQNQEWLFSVLIPGYVSSTSSNNLLHKMFHIGKKPFDQVLSGEWKPDFLGILERPLSLSREATWLNLSKRPDFMGEPSFVSKHDRAVVANISSLFINDD